MVELECKNREWAVIDELRNTIYRTENYEAAKKEYERYERGNLLLVEILEEK